MSGPIGWEAEEPVRGLGMGHPVAGLEPALFATCRVWSFWQQYIEAGNVGASGTPDPGLVALEVPFQETRQRKPQGVAARRSGARTCSSVGSRRLLTIQKG